MPDQWHLPIKIASPVRLAVVAPGKPWPEALISSDDEISDLLGFYSIRESGLGLDQYDKPRNSPIDALMKLYGFGPITRPRFGVTDFWEGDTSDRETSEKRRLFSIVFDLQDAPRSVSHDFFNQNLDLKRTLDRIAASYRNGDCDDLLYQSHILSAYLGQQVSYHESRYRTLYRTNLAFLFILSVLTLVVTMFEIFAKV